MTKDANKVKQYILKLIQNGEEGVVKKTIATFEVSSSCVYNYLKELSEEGYITKKSRDCYELVKNEHIFIARNDGSLREERFFTQYIEPVLKDIVNANSMKIWLYAFSEIMNNAIEHSEAEEIKCTVITNPISTEIYVSDNGVGIFRNVINYMKQSRNEDITIDDAIEILLPGKFTTNARAHSGEGIFFSSRAVDSFIIMSENRVFCHDIFAEKSFDSTENMPSVGTKVAMRLSNQSNKLLKDIFDRFSDVDTGFYKTQIPISHAFSTFPVSRSEARRLCGLFESFSEIELDFTAVEYVGQAFAHEIFVVYQNANPQRKIQWVNANADVEGMIKRVINEAKHRSSK